MNFYSKLISNILIPVLTTGTILGGAATYNPSKTEIIKGIESLNTTIITLKQKLDKANSQIIMANTEMSHEQDKYKETVNDLNSEITRLNDEINRTKMENSKLTPTLPPTNTDLVKIIKELNKPDVDTNILIDSKTIELPTNIFTDSKIVELPTN